MTLNRNTYEGDNILDGYRLLIQRELDYKGLNVDDMQLMFKIPHEYYNFRDFMKGSKNVCSYTFFEKIINKLGKESNVKIEVLDKQ